jgi:DNA-binding NarL/FixJ family response regulator
MAGEVRVLVIDDHPDITQLIDTVLSLSKGYTVVGKAADGAEGIALAEKVTADLILLDVSMPVMDGIAALPRLREVAPDARIVFLTALDEWKLDETPTPARADGLVSKTVLPWGLVPELEKVMR